MSSRSTTLVLRTSTVEVRCSGNNEAVISTALQQASYIEPQDNEVCRLGVAGRREAGVLDTSRNTKQWEELSYLLLLDCGVETS